MVTKAVPRFHLCPPARLRYHYSLPCSRASESYENISADMSHQPQADPSNVHATSAFSPSVFFPSFNAGSINATALMQNKPFPSEFSFDVASEQRQGIRGNATGCVALRKYYQR